MSKHDEIHKIWVNGTHNSLTTKLFLGPLRRASGQKLKYRDVTTGATGATEVAPKFSDTLTLSLPRGADSAHHHRGRS